MTNDHNEKRTKRNQLIASIVAHLTGAELTYDCDGDAKWAEYADGRQIWFYLNEYQMPPRLQVSGNWPKCRVATDRHSGPIVTPRDVLAYKEESPYREIKISAGKAPATIAAEIERRFMPGYVEMFNRCAARRDERDAEATAKANLEKYLAALTGDNRLGLSTKFTEKFNCYGRVEVLGSNSVEITLRGLSSKTAVAILNTLETL